MLIGNLNQKSFPQKRVYERIDPDIFKTSPTGYSYIGMGMNVSIDRRQTKFNVSINKNILRDIWRLILLPR